MAGFAEIGYLTSIVLLRGGIASPEKALLGENIYKALSDEAHAYFKLIGEGKFRRLLEGNLRMAVWPNDPEHNYRLAREDYADLARDRLIDWNDSDLNYPQILYVSRYWMHNGAKKGIRFMHGIGQDDLLVYFHELDPKLEWYALERMADIKSDDDLWAFVNTWLEENWRS